MKERICFICEKPLDYMEYIESNKESLRELDDKWDSDIVEFYCCSCKRFIMELQNGSIDLYRLLEWAENGRLMKLKKLGLICEEDIIEMKRLKNEQ